MNNELEVINKFDPELNEEIFESLKKNHAYIGEKLILDLVNGVDVVAKDLNDSAKGKEKGLSRIWDGVSGNAKKRQNQINKNFIYAFKATLEYLQDHDRHISRIDMRIKDVADILYDTREEIVKKFKGVDLSIEMLEDFKKNAEKRLEKIEKRLEKIEAQQQIDREVAKIGSLELPVELEIFTVLDNLASGEFGIWYELSQDKTKKVEQLVYLKNKIAEKIDVIQIRNFIDFYAVYEEVTKLEEVEQKALAFISSQYRQFNEDRLYDGIDIIKLVTTVKNREELEKNIEQNSHISTFMTLEDFIDDTTEYVLDFNSKKAEVSEINNDVADISIPKVYDKNKKLKKISTQMNNNAQKVNKYKLGIVLSGGGAKGAYEVGFLKALAEFNIQPKAIAGTSIGALNGAIYSAKKDTRVSAKCLEDLWNDLATSSVLEIDKETAVKTIIDVLMHFVPMGNVTKLGKLLMLSAKGAKSTEGILTQAPLINRLEKHASAKDLKKGLPFHIGLTKSKGHAMDTYNFLGFGNEETVYKKIQNLKEEEMHTAIMASASLPILFNSLEVEGDIYSDGCLSSTDNEWGNTPIKPLIEDEGCTHIIICHLNEGSFFDSHDALFKDIPIIEVRPEVGTFNSALDPLQFKVEKIAMWMDQGYKDSKRILGEAFYALEDVSKRKKGELKSNDSVDRVKNSEFKL